MKLMIIILSVLFSTTAFSQSSACFGEENSTLSLEECQKSELDRVNAELAVALKQVAQKSYPGHSAEKAKSRANYIKGVEDELVVAGKRCDFEVADRDGGTGQGFAKLECMTKATQDALDLVQSLNILL